MIDPFDSEFISQELRDAWRKIEQLEEENRELKEHIAALEEIQEEELDQKQREWNFEEHDEEDGWENILVIGDRHEMGG